MLRGIWSLSPNLVSVLYIPFQSPAFMPEYSLPFVQLTYYFIQYFSYFQQFIYFIIQGQPSNCVLLTTSWLFSFSKSNCRKDHCRKSRKYNKQKRRKYKLHSIPITQKNTINILINDFLRISWNTQTQSSVYSYTYIYVYG